MWILDILNLNRRKLNHHEQVSSQESIPEAAYREQELGGAGIAALIRMMRSVPVKLKKAA